MSPSRGAGGAAADGPPPLQTSPRSGLRGVITRLSPRCRSPSGRRDGPPLPPAGPACRAARGNPNKIRRLRDFEENAFADFPRVPEAGGQLQKDVCEVVRVELRQQLREATSVLQEAVRSEVSRALTTAPAAPAWLASPAATRDGRGNGIHAELHSPAKRDGHGKLEEAAFSTQSFATSSADPAPSSHVHHSLKTQDPATSLRVNHSLKTQEKMKHLAKFAEKRPESQDDDGRPTRSSSSFAVVEIGKGQCVDFLNHIWTLKEPARDGVVARVLLSEMFEAVLQAVILVNCAFMVFAANNEIRNWDGSPSSFIRPVETSFQVFYTLELIAKLVVHRLFFFWNVDWGLNWLDFMLVVTGGLELTFAFHGHSNLTYMRSLRVVKVAKALRVVRVISGFAQLRNIIICLYGSLMNLVWSIVMLAVVLYMFSLCFVLSSATYLQETGVDMEETSRTDLLNMYGSVQTAMLTLYMAAFGGEDWSMSYNAIAITGWLAAAVYILFTLFMQIALVNIITGIFVDAALDSLAPDREAQALNHHKQEEELAEEMCALWREVDKDGDGRLSQASFHEGLRRNKIPPRLMMMGLSIDNVIELFGVLRKNSPYNGEVDIEGFVQGCMRLKGSASSFDLQELRVEVRALVMKVEELSGAVGIGHAGERCVTKDSN